MCGKACCQPVSTREFRGRFFRLTGKDINTKDGMQALREQMPRLPMNPFITAMTHGKLKWFRPNPPSGELIIPELSSWQLQRFKKEFSKVPGSSHLIKLSQRGIIQRWGATHHIDVALSLGRRQIKAFEVEHKPVGQATKKVDIVTNDNIAVECKAKLPFLLQTRPGEDFQCGDARDPERKAWASPKATFGEVSSWCKQAATRLESDVKGHRFRAVIVVTPDYQLETLTDYDLKRINEIYPGVCICEVSQLHTQLHTIRRQTGGGLRQWLRQFGL